MYTLLVLYWAMVVICCAGFPGCEIYSEAYDQL